MRAILFILLVSFSFALTAQEQLPINTSKSQIQWLGEYTFYFGGHDGYIQFKEGHFIKTNDVLTGGEFVIDMNSMTNNDIDDDEGKESLINHLKDPDFFDVAKYPLAKLEITNIKYDSATELTIQANMTIKGQTHPISFRAEADYDTKQLHTKFKIDRRLWGVNYTSKLRDGAISDAIGFVVTLSL